MREQIVSEIKRITEANGGQPPGVKLFENETGIAEHRWRGRYWAKWSDALTEAGYQPNTLTPRSDAEIVMVSLIAACRHFGHIPTVAELKLYKRIDKKLPSTSAINRHFGNQAGMIEAIFKRCQGDDLLDDVAKMIPVSTFRPETELDLIAKAPTEGFVYLMKSGEFYKIGRSDDLERRIKQITVALPQSVSLIHSIRTDDPSGIETYWHRRFASQRANGEWFKLSSHDVAAFRRRTFQ